MSARTQHADPRRANPRRAGLRRTVVPLVAVGLGMAGLAWAAVPLYDLFCRVTGYGGTTQVAASAPAEVLDRTVRVRFVGSRMRDVAVEFRPVTREMELNIGETGVAYYEAYNPTGRIIATTASYNVTPFSVGGYFTKIECFCFTEQVLQPGERAEMPVTFYVDPAMVGDPETERVHTITLSYTLYETELDSQAALGQTKTDAGVN